MDFVESIVDYFRDNAGLIVSRTVAAFIIILVTALCASLASRAVRRALEQREEKRTATLAPLMATFTRLVIMAIGIVMALNQFGVNVAAILAGAGVLGLAIGFGAQELVKDVISGFFLILDGVLQVGDFAKVDDAVGQVESVGLRMTRIRSFDGTLWYVPNGQIQTVGSMSREWMRAVVNVGLAYEQDAAKGLKVLQEAGDEWAREHEDIIIERPEAQGVLGLNASDVGVRLIVKVKAGEHWAAERSLSQRIKAKFDAEDVEIPFPRQVVYHRQDDGPLSVLADNPPAKAG